MDEETKQLAETTGKLLVAHMKAQASVFVALLSTLVEAGLLSAESVESRILTGLEETYQSSPISTPEDEMEAQAAQQLIGVIRRRLLDPA